MAQSTSSNGRARVLLLIPHLGGGGAERVAELLASHLSREKYDVHLGVVTQSPDHAGAQRFEISVHWLGARRVRAGALRLLRLIRELRPDVVLSGMAHLNFLVLGLRPFFPRTTRVLVRQNSTASAAIEFGGLPASTRTLYRHLYRRADRVICQTQAMAVDLQTWLGVPAQRIAVLPNPVNIDAIRRDATLRTGEGATDAGEQAGAGPHLLAVGRLSREKGFDLLLHALARIRVHFSQADLTILGAGPDDALLRAQCAELGLREAVRFAGCVPNVAAYFGAASVFVLSSRYEGLPNALLEAAAGGLPIVAAPSSDGVVELLRGRRGVWLAAETSDEALVAALLQAIENLSPGERFEHAFVEQFRLEDAVAKYEALIDALLDEASR